MLSIFGIIFLTRCLISHALRLGHQGVAQWWHRNRPFIVESARKYGALLMALLLPFTPRAARQAGYRGASHTVFKALDHLDASLPGSGQGWSKRWMNRPRGRPDAGFRASLSMEGTVGNVGVAAAAVVFAAGMVRHRSA